jgi:hypothetical protein
MTKTRPAPLGATYKPNVRPSWFSPRPDVAPSGARPVLFDPSYKDFAPPELGRRIAKRADSSPWVTTHSNALNKPKLAKRLRISDQILVNFVSLADVASRVYHISGVNGGKSALW